MKTDLSPLETDFIPNYTGWENDFDERCRRDANITVKLQARDQPAGVVEEIQNRAIKNGMELVSNQADQEPSILLFKKTVQ